MSQKASPGLGIFTCNICGKVCTAKAQLKSHIQRFYIRGKPFKCDKCDDCFVTSNGLLKHIKMHDRPLTKRCKFCDKKFYSERRLRKHIITHTGIY